MAGERKGKSMTAPSVVLVKSEIVVLVAWNDGCGLQVINAILTQPEFRVLSTEFGEEAVILYQRHQDEIDLVLLNYSLWRMSGPATFDALREVNPNVRCAFMTAHPPDVIEASMNDLLSRGVVGWLWKPFRSDELIGFVRECSLR
jgi:two-component system, cell cycle sensor histidine kinase and response regulator CckA